MKYLLLLAVLLPAAVLADEPRLCPEGYTYVGDDLPPPADTRNWVMEEVDRTEMYSCYKIVYDAQATWLSASHACQEEEAQLVSFEQEGEMEMVAKLRRNSGEHNILTSALRFSDGWYWVGSNSKIASSMTINEESENTNPAYPDSRYTEDCLAFNLPADSPDEEGDNNGSNVEPFVAEKSTLKTVPCTIKTPKYDSYMCEARVQTVTYITWFQANWIDFTLTALIIILFTALCVTLCCYPSQKNYHHSSANHRRPISSTTGRRNNRTTDDVVVKPPAYEMPPTYGDAVRVHAPVNKDETTAVPLSMMDRFKRQGSELVAKVYYYRTPRSTNSGNGNA